MPDGTILALLGPNGAGKTTIVRMLVGVLAMTSGRATVAGNDVGRDPAAVRAHVGLVTDVPGLHEQMTVPAYLDFFGAIYGMSRAARARRIDELLAFFDLEEHRRERMVGFSKGMKQKVALARAMLHDPAALFLDEPTSGLDPLSARSVRELILTMKRASRSIVLCTHDLDEADRLADEIVILREGRVVASGEPSRLRALGSPETTVRIVLARAVPRRGDGASRAGRRDRANRMDAHAGRSGGCLARVPHASPIRGQSSGDRATGRLGSADHLRHLLTMRSLEDVYAAVMGAGQGNESTNE